MKKIISSALIALTMAGCSNTNHLTNLGHNNESLIREQIDYFASKLRYSKLRIKQIDESIVIQAKSTVFFQNEQYSSFNSNGYKEYRKIIDFMLLYPESVVTIQIHTDIQREKSVIEHIVHTQSNQFIMVTKEIPIDRIIQSKENSPVKCLIDNFFTECPKNRVSFIFNNKSE